MGKRKFGQLAKRQLEDSTVQSCQGMSPVLNLISWNVNGYVKRANEILILASKYQPEAFLLQETHLNEKSITITPPGYRLLRKDRIGKRKGGVGILIKENSDYAEENIDTGTVESITISMETKEKRPILITSTYCPPNMQVKKPDIMKLPGSKPSALIAGDLNAKNTTWGHKTTNYYGKWFEEFTEINTLNFHIPDEPTRKANSRTDMEDILDYTIATDNIKLKQTVLKTEFNTSDHIPILIEITSHTTGSTKNEELYETRWDLVIKDIDRTYNLTEDVEYDVNHLTATLQCALLNNTRTKKKKRFKVHANKTVLNLIEEKRKADKRYKITRSHQDKQDQRKLKKQLNRLLKEMEEEQHLKKIFSLNDPLLRWQTLKKGKPTPPPIPTLEVNGVLGNTTRKKCEMLADSLEEKFKEHPTNQNQQLKENIEKYFEELQNKKPIPYKELMYKLHLKNQPEWFIILMNNYYQDRSFYVKIHSITSTIRIIEAGTAQGAVLSPILYSIYISDMPHTPEIKIYQYADDTLYLAAKNDCKETLQDMNEQLALLYEWCNNWKTKINASKSTAITLLGCKRPREEQIWYGPSEIPHEVSLKYLGITLDRGLRFTQHITNILNTGRIKTASLRQYLKKKHITTVKTRILLYNALIKPTMTYGLPAWNNIARTNWEKLEHVEKGWAKYVQYLPILTPSEIVRNNMPFKTIQEERIEAMCKTFVTSRKHPNPLMRQIPVTAGKTSHKTPLDGDFILEELRTQLEAEDITAERETYLNQLVASVEVNPQ
ncbi:hypothetical protein FOCC_FOCC016423 [Frankliniella occidentalis]|nr:hypothetical protein FOCC_FOCC016423 [Frankliniella occidentalis]